MITLLCVLGFGLGILFLIGIGVGLIAISPVLAVLLCLPLLDVLVFKLIKALKK